MKNCLIRNEHKEDYFIVEEITREAFWNLYVPGCDEHFLVHLMRTSADFVPELAFVAEIDKQVVGSIFFTKSYIIDNFGVRHEMLTFGPVSVLPELQNKGIGSTLIAHAIKMAEQLAYRAILIYGYFTYYKRFGFRHGKEFNISNPRGKFPVSHLILELYGGALTGISGKAFESRLFNIDQVAAASYDTLFKPKRKKIMPSQHTFAKTVSSYI